METEPIIHVHVTNRPVDWSILTPTGLTGTDCKCEECRSPWFTLVFGVVCWLGILATLIAPLPYTRTQWTDDPWISPRGWVGVYANQIDRWGEPEPDHIYTVQFVARAWRDEHMDLRLYHLTEETVCNRTLFHESKCAMFRTMRISKGLIMAGSVIGMIGLMCLIPFQTNHFILHPIACLFLILSVVFQYISVKVVSNNVQQLNHVSTYVEVGLGETPHVQLVCAIVNSVAMPLCVILLTVARCLHHK